MHEEYVLVFPAKVLNTVGYFQGLEYDFDKYLIAIAESGFEFDRRDTAESSTLCKQLITYAILTWKGHVFSYKRGTDAGENRLLGKFSIGVGGHVVRGRSNKFQRIWENSMLREVREEIDVMSEYRKSVAAVINDDCDDVGKVHFGIVCVFLLKEPRVALKEESLEHGDFVDPLYLRRNIGKYEKWSQICIGDIEGLLAARRLRGRRRRGVRRASSGWRLGSDRKRRDKPA
jgi:predicted NUDIX family phosphoesterase